MNLNKTEENILNSIVVASENNPNKPEFPYNNPKFPATPTYKINIEGFDNVYLKDESKNPTGTHKDRMAWEIVVTYREFLIAKKIGLNNLNLPQMSILSSGSAAFAIQSLLNEFNLPNLKVLVDINTEKFVLDKLKYIGCEIYQTVLSSKLLNWEDILNLTENKNGFDITSSDALDPTTKFYDWLSFEIINSSPDYCFIPFGTGNLYENILNVSKKQITSDNKDPRFLGDIQRLRKCNFIGTTTNNPRSKAAEKLYSPHLPFSHYNEQWINLYKRAGFCGSKSGVFTIKEEYLEKALKIAKEQNINCEPSGIAGLAKFIEIKNSIPKDKKILIVNTGKVKY